MSELVLKKRSLWILILVSGLIASLFMFKLSFYYITHPLSTEVFIYNIFRNLYLFLSIPWILSILFEDRQLYILKEIKKNAFFYLLILLLGIPATLIDIEFYFFLTTFLLSLYSSVSVVRYIDNLDVNLNLSDENRDINFILMSIAFFSSSTFGIIFSEITPHPSSIIWLFCYNVFMWTLLSLLYIICEILIMIKDGFRQDKILSLDDVTDFEDIIERKTRVKGPAQKIISAITHIKPCDSESIASRIKNTLNEIKLTKNPARLNFIKEKYGIYGRKRFAEDYEKKLLVEALEIPSRIPALVLVFSNLNIGISEIPSILSTSTGVNYYQYFSRFKERLFSRKSALYWLKSDIFYNISEKNIQLKEEFIPLSESLRELFAYYYQKDKDLGAAAEKFRKKMEVILNEIKK